ncbi:preprotein translocase subunit SecY [Escherichia coli]|nr:preprotein translocase subunit SecY [Escherichia coli]OTD13623.1 preprotein translocase subunit SecY [Escherichia coli]OTE41709.1 preprotein translocase subunit SecY [Escherichia coli]
MNFTDLHMIYQSNALIIMNKIYALGRSLVIFKNPVSRS